MTAIERYNTKTLRTFAIGDIGPAGGFIFATPSTAGNATGKYFEAAPYGWNGAGADPKRTWAQTDYQTVNVSGATGQAFGDGYANTLAIIAQGNTNTATSAAALARSCTSGGKNDWFLPSSSEVGQLVSALYFDNGDIGGLVNPEIPGTANYWASTQETNNIYGDAVSRARMWLWLDEAGPFKSDMYSVRPVRMFSVEYSTSVQRIGNDSVYGGGQDGTVVIASNTSLTRDMYYSSLTINNGSHLNTNGFKVFVKGRLTVNGSIGINAGVTVSNATLAGTANIATGTTNSIGGSAAGITYIASQASSSVRSYIENVLNGGVVSTSGTFSAFTGGAGGEDGAAGTVTPATAGTGATAGGAGGAGSLSRNPGVAGGPGTNGTPGSNGVAGSTPPAAAGGSGARGGGVVVVVAKTISGTGSIVSLGSNASLGGSSATGTGATSGAAGSAGSAAPTASLAYTVDNHAHYITGDGTHGAHASTPAPALPTQYVAGLHSVHASGYNIQTHHKASCIYGENHHTGSSPHTNGHIPHSTYHTPRAPASDYFHQNGINHTEGGPFGVVGGGASIARNQISSHTAGTNNYHETDHCPGGTDFKGSPLPPHTQTRQRSDAWGYHYNDDTRFPGSQRHTGNASKAGGTGGAAGAAGSSGTNGSTTAGGNGKSGGGGGILIVTDTTPSGVTTSVSGGTIGGVSGSDGNAITILNA